MTQKIEEISAVSRGEFASRIQGRAQPVVLRGQLDTWPAVRLARESPRALFESLRSLDDGQPVSTMYAQPEVRGRFFYGPALEGLNFQQRQQALGEAIRHILDCVDAPAPPAIYVGAVPLQGRGVR